MYKQDVTETPPKALPADESIDVLPEDHPNVELDSLENIKKIENCPIENESGIEEDQNSKENQRTRRRRYFTAKQEYPENVSQNTPTLPSYMAHTKSAKAKLKAQGSPRVGEDGAENNFLRRYSLPSSTNGKLSSLSPRVHRPLQANGKGGSRSDIPLFSSRDEKELLQPGWRR